MSTGTTPKEYDKISEGDNLINWYTPSDILEGCNDLFSSLRKLSEKIIYENKISLFPIGTLLYVGIGASAGKVGYANEKGYSNQQITSLIPLGCYSRFYFYYLSVLKDKIRDNAFFTTLPIINNVYLGQELIPYPLFSEQQSIATYLDQKCGEIDELITLQEEMITKLQSYKQSVITEAVTKGLDKNVPLKDSGIEWIGNIPEHWEVKRLKNVCSQINIKENSKKNSLPYIGLENIESGSGRYIDTTSEVEGMANRFWKNNVLFGKLRPYLSKVYLAEKGGICSTEFIVYDTKSNNCRFIHKLLLSQAFIDVVNSSTYGAKMPRANSEFINNIYVQIPPLSEQQSIANYLDKKCSEIDELISIKQQKIEKLKDYKKSLIFECVTGKRKVS